MSLVLSHITAYEFWLSSHSINKPEFAQEKRHPLLDSRKITQNLCQTRLSSLYRRYGGIQSPMHLLVGSPDRRAHSTYSVSHVLTASSLPNDCLLQAGRNLYVASPELCFLQLARSRDGLDLIRMGNELCSRYYGSLEKYDELPERQPICTRESILAFLEKVSDASGARRALHAAQWIANGVRSPREATLAALLAAPSRIGGQQMPPFEANYGIPLQGDSSLLTQRRSLEIDIYWPDAKVGIEYNSLLHEGFEPTQRDLEKITAMQARESTIVPLSSWQFDSYDRFEAVVVIVRRLLGLRNRPSDAVLHKRRMAHLELLDAEAVWRKRARLDDYAWWRIISPMVGSCDG